MANLRPIQRVKNSYEQIKDLSTKPTDVSRPSGDNVGTCIIVKSVKFGPGCICTIKDSNSALINQNGHCKSGLLEIGDVVEYKLDGKSGEIILSNPNNGASSNISTALIPVHGHQGITDGGITMHFFGQF